MLIKSNVLNLLH